MEDTVRSFNNLNRPRTTPTGLPSYWVFVIRRVSLEPPGDVVVVSNPQSGLFLLPGGQFEFPSLSDASAKAQALLPHLLGAFINGAESPGGRRPTDPPPFAPWTWATEDPELAKALEKCLSQRGVVRELCRVGTCSADDKKKLQEAWDKVCRTAADLVGLSAESSRPQPAVAPGDSTRCHGCGINNEGLSEPLKKCAACGKAWYHSRDCQRAHWKEHKPACLANRPATAPSSSTGAATSKVDGHKYYNTTARSSPEAKALMKTLYLSFPSSPSAVEGIAKPVRSMVYAGKDTPENMKVLFGPDWRSSIGKYHDEARIHVLINPAPGSPSYALHKGMTDSRLDRSPRPATDSEKQMMSKIRDMQDVVRQRIGVGKSPSSSDMQAILSSYGPDWTSHLDTYMLAINTMDQGVKT